MKILYITQRLPFGDGETFIIPEIDALLAAGHDVLLVPRAGGDPVLHRDAAALVTRTRTLPGAARIAGATVASLARAPAETAAAFWAMHHTRPRRRAVANARAVAEGMWVAGLATRWGAEHIHAHWAHLTATLAMSASVATGIPWSFTAHRYDVILNNLLAEKLRSATFGRFIAREMLAIASRNVAPDALERAAVLHMGVTVPREVAPTPPPRPVPVVLCPARLVPVKGHGCLIDAAQLLTSRGVHFELWIAGDGPERPALERRIEGLGLADRIRLLGTLPHDDLLRLYRERGVDGVVLPSLDLGGGLHEGLSVGLVEAMAHAIPVIGTRTGGLPELLEGGAGLLVEPGDPVGLSASLGEVLVSADLRARLGAAGRRRVEEQFDVEAIARQLVRWFDAGLPLAAAA
jgi:colanic acid/amylovoran biosynthesis glycosyltransferase